MKNHLFSAATAFRILLIAAVMFVIIAVSARLTGMPRPETPLPGLMAWMALAFCVFMSAQLLPPGPVMPDRIRLSHMAELASSGLVFGWLTVWIITRGGAAKGEKAGS